MSKFQSGRKVRKRGSTDKGVIRRIDGERAEVVWDSYAIGWNHFELLKLLKPRTPKPEARVGREWTVRLTNIGFGHGFIIDAGQTIMDKEAFTVIEKLPGQITVSREQLAKALAEANVMHVSSLEKAWFNNFCELLGFNPSEMA